LRVGLPLGFFMGPGIPLMRAQNDLRLFAALLPALSLDGFVVTAVFNLLPGLARLKALTPADVSPPDLLL
tara:strand:+ start:1112 stop:1321 length:210 start_codon:yes stop_codon:yes gene_type:complete